MVEGQGRRGGCTLEGGQYEKFSDKISLIYFSQIEAFHVGVMGRGEKKHTLCPSLKDF